MKKLLEYEGRDVNSVDENQRTAFFFAAGLGSEKCVRLLVEAGADVHWQDKDGFTALHIAAGYVHTSVVKTLLEFGANPELEDAKGRSSLLLAQELLEKTPRTNPMQFARRLALDQVHKIQTFPLALFVCWCDRERMKERKSCYHQWDLDLCFNENNNHGFKAEALRFKGLYAGGQGFGHGHLR